MLFHHAQGLTPGCLSFAERLRAAGHVVHAPDLYEGRTLTDLSDGMGYAEEIGFGTIIERGRLAADGLPSGLVYAGFSLGVLPAQMLAQTRPGTKGALLFHSCVPPSEFGRPWPQGIPLQIHMMDADELSLPPNEDLAAARERRDGGERDALLLSRRSRPVRRRDPPRLRRARRRAAHRTGARLPRENRVDLSFVGRLFG
jgi:dienelactone hydrolase